MAAPSSAVSIYAAYWDTNDVGETGGLGISFAFGGKFALEIAGTYYEELTEDPLDLLEDGDSPFVSEGFEIIPIDAGLLFRTGTGRNGGLYFGLGATLFMIDTSAAGVTVDDEAGWYGKVGFDFGGGQRGPGFFAEALLREVDAEVGADLGFLETSNFELDLGGISFHLGVRF